MQVVAVFNPKGGVGRTTTVINLGAALASIGERVLVIDLDFKDNVSTGLSIRSDKQVKTVFDVLTGKSSVSEARVSTHVPGLSVVPSGTGLHEIDGGVCHGALCLREAISADGGSSAPFDYVLIDCPPSFGCLNSIALATADGVLAPVQCEYFGLRSIPLLKEQIDRAKATVNSALEIFGVLLTFYDPRMSLSREVAENVRAFFGPMVYTTVIPRNTRIAEAPSHGKPILLYDFDCAGSQAYIKLATEIIERQRNAKQMNVDIDPETPPLAGRDEEVESPEQWISRIDREIEIDKATTITFERLYELVKRGYRPDFEMDYPGAIWLRHPAKHWRHKLLFLGTSGCVVSPDARSDDFRFDRNETVLFEAFLKTVPRATLWDRTREFRMSVVGWAILLIGALALGTLIDAALRALSLR